MHLYYSYIILPIFYLYLYYSYIVLSLFYTVFYLGFGNKHWHMEYSCQQFSQLERVETAEKAKPSTKATQTFISTSQKVGFYSLTCKILCSYEYISIFYVILQSSAMLGIYIYYSITICYDILQYNYML